MIDLEKLSKEHEALFPNATLESQVWKLEEEIIEAEEAETEEQLYKEIADFYIVCIGISRFCPKLAELLIRRQAFSPEQQEIIEQTVLRKWEVNKSRKWEWNGKTYKHVGKDGNE